MASTEKPRPTHSLRLAMVALLFYTTAASSRSASSCADSDGNLVQSGRRVGNLFCTTAFPESEYPGTCDTRRFVACTCRFGTWTDCSDPDTRPESGKDDMIDEASGNVLSEPVFVATAEETESPAACKHEDASYSPGSVVGWVNDEGAFLSCKCLASGDWSCKDLSRKKISSCLYNGQEFQIGSTRSNTITAMELELSEECGCASSGLWTCKLIPVSTDKYKPQSTACDVNGFAFPVGTEFVTNRQKCICKEGGLVHCEQLPGARPCVYYGFEFPHGSEQSDFHTDANGNQIIETCICNDSTWNCERSVTESYT